MSSKMLIDASHAEETRVVVTENGKVKDFDFESEHKKQIRGNIYLAKVTRVEPSLQAAFVEYGGNRHGFLAFSEIHPDYYQIPVADREALLREYARELAEDEDVEDAEVIAESDGEEASETDRKSKRRSRRGGRSRRGKGREASAASDADHGDADSGGGGDQPADSEQPDGNDAEGGEIAAMVDADEVSEDLPTEPAAEEDKPKRRATRRRKAPIAATPEAEGSSSEATVTEHDDGAGARAEAGNAIEADADAEPEKKPRRTRRSTKRAAAPAAQPETAEPSEGAGEADAPAPETVEDLALNEAEGGEPVAEVGEEKPKPKRARRSRSRKPADREEATENAKDTGDAEDESDTVEGKPVETGADDALEEAAPRRQRAPRKHYKIQEVIKRRQILLVQVTKEERGNKGAALTTYLSLAGRYSVLMPNTARGGGISRKIAQASDRKRLKEIAKDLEVPEGMGVILRTAAAARTKQEVHRDFDYLMRLWDSVRELTLSSSAPALVYEEGDLIKRSIRDLYNKDISEILVSGDEGYREAKDFMKMLMPSQARVVKRWTSPTPMLTSQGVEAELDRMLQPNVTLRSGGYIIINQTEALVAIDVNSGRATREHSIEATALQTNLEAAEEVARQLRLRDLAGLIVIDFIDMDENRNNRAVEKKLKDCLKDDRARIQLGRISSFGLLEMSRQRMRSSVLESTMQVCEHCNGTGHVRSASSIGLQILRAVEEQMRKTPNHSVTVRTDATTALHVLNNKRDHIADLEAKHGVPVRLEADATLSNQNFVVERGPFVERAASAEKHVRQDASLMEDEAEEEDRAVAEEPEVVARSDDEDQSGGKRRRRGRRGGKGRSGDATDATSSDDRSDAADDVASVDTASAESSGEAGDSASPARSDAASEEEPVAKPARRSRRRKAPSAESATDDQQDESPVAPATEPQSSDSVAEQSAPQADDSDADAKPRRSTRRKKAPLAAAADADGSTDGDDASASAATDAADTAKIAEDKPKRRTSRRKAPVKEEVIDSVVAVNGSDLSPSETAATSTSDAPNQEETGTTKADVEASGDQEPEGEGKSRKGWWTKGFF